MCLEDVRLGRKTRFTARKVTVTNAEDKVVVPWSATRVAIHIRPATSGDVLIGPFAGGTVSAYGFLFSSTLYPIDLTIDRHGETVISSWLARASAGDVDLIVIETFLEEK